MNCDYYNETPFYWIFMSNIFIFLLVFLCFGCNCYDVFLMYIRLCLICVHVSCISAQPIGRILDWSSKLALICKYGDTN